MVETELGIKEHIDWRGGRKWIIWSLLSHGREFGLSSKPWEGYEQGSKAQICILEPSSCLKYGERLEGDKCAVQDMS